MCPAKSSSTCVLPGQLLPLALSSQGAPAGHRRTPLLLVVLILALAGCDFSGQDLSGKVFSGVMLQGANLANVKVVGSQFARADAKGAILTNVDFTDTNCYGT